MVQQHVIYLNFEYD